MATSPQSRPWWDILVAECLAEGIICAGLTPAYLASAYARLFGHTDKATLLSTVLVRILDDPPGPTIPYFYPCGGDTKRVIVKPVRAFYATRMRMGVRYPADRSLPPRVIIDGDLWEAAGSTSAGFTAALLAQYGPAVQAETYSRNSKGEWKAFNKNDKRAIARVHAALSAPSASLRSDIPDGGKP